ncbi:MAG: FixH family protein [Leptospiraceae bacterium]|nr:FixH family protein [Leptospiraceae bacterium]
MKTAFWLIGIFFVVLFIALGYTLKVAFENQEPILDESYYEKGLDYQAHIDAREKAEKLGFVIQSDLFEKSSLSRGQQNLKWTLVIPAGQSVDRNSLEFKLILDQPATSKYRQIVDIKGSEASEQNGNLVFEKEVTLNRPGYWDLSLEGKADGLTFYKAHRLVVN